jgi:hypothetical protein
MPNRTKCIKVIKFVKGSSVLASVIQVADTRVHLSQEYSISSCVVQNFSSEAPTHNIPGPRMELSAKHQAACNLRASPLHYPASQPGGYQLSDPTSSHIMKNHFWEWGLRVQPKQCNYWRRILLMTAKIGIKDPILHAKCILIIFSDVRFTED